MICQVQFILKWNFTEFDIGWYWFWARDKFYNMVPLMTFWMNVKFFLYKHRSKTLESGSRFLFTTVLFWKALESFWKVVAAVQILADNFPGRIQVRNTLYSGFLSSLLHSIIISSFLSSSKIQENSSLWHTAIMYSFTLLTFYRSL